MAGGHPQSELVLGPRQRRVRAQSTLNEGIGKAVYLTPDNYLVKQVREEAARLDMATTDDPYEPAFLSAEAVLVTNYQKLINGKSAGPHRFGAGPVLGVGRQARGGVEDPAPASGGAGFYVRVAVARRGAASVHRDVEGDRDQALVPAPIDRIPSFVRARRRVYLTAMLADDSALVTDFGADPKLVAKPVTPGSASDLGERMILAPRALNPGLDDEAVRVLARQFADGDQDGDSLAETDPVNVVVLVNKYDGVNLPAGACRLLILDGIPRPLDGVERREAVALADSTVRLAREIQRIEQGMGRGVRDGEDYCAVLLLGANLAVAINDARRLALLSPATQAQLKLSRDIAGQIKGEGLNAVREALRACLGRVPQWRERSRRALADVRYAEHGTVRGEAVALREAFDLAAMGRTPAAVERVQKAANDLGNRDTVLRGWLREQKAAYLHLTGRVATQQALAGALNDKRRGRRSSS
ncbi:hypothetical protein [Streptomyces sp. NBRC 109706]|uniref:hypothetical protein n=1 Tax=Streptomyces sp. NBRC 109706 TaxID=1550035 RepID=UPI001F2CCF53|nr:hypothetical protein [Streptomyces sp. NBRC 109706]